MAIYFPNSELTDPCGEGWRITSNFTGSQNPMTNWERSDDVYGGTNFSGNLVSQSNGIFSFNTYGWFLLDWNFYSYNNDNVRYIEMALQVSWNNGSNFDQHVYALGQLSPNSSSNYSQGGSASGFILGNANTRFKFRYNAQNSGLTTYGSTDECGTGFTIYKVASENP